MRAVGCEEVGVRLSGSVPACVALPYADDGMLACVGWLREYRGCSTAFRMRTLNARCPAS